MARLPVIVGFGGYNAAGRASFHHGYRRMVIESLDRQSRQETLAGLAVMSKIISVSNGEFHSADGQTLSLADIEQHYGQQILDATLVRRIEKTFFDVDNASWQQAMTLDENSDASGFVLSRSQIPNPVPKSWHVTALNDKQVRVSLPRDAVVKVESKRDYPVKAAGQLPSGFNPAEFYNSRFHPRGLQMAILGASDAVHSMGIPWETVKQAVKPDEIAVYASSAMGQLDDDGTGGLLKSRLEGGRVSAKQLALGLNSMPADFINAYVLGNVGTTGCVTGACASFLYNLKSGIDDIQQKRARVVMVGCSEAPITQEVIDGYATMGALGTDEGLRKIEGLTEGEPDHRRASRPFSDNCGFTIAESSQFFILMDDELALQLGAQIHGAVTDVFINADGFKKSIPAPGPGNYITLAKAVAAAGQILGMDTVRERSMVMAHGSSTPQNRVTESELLDTVAAAFDIRGWPVAAVKSYLGHPLAPASGDQLAVALGTFHYNVLPGIKTIDAVADDVADERLMLPLQDVDLSDRPPQVAFLNSKGFGGNNATAVVLSADAVMRMLNKRHGEQTLEQWQSDTQTAEARARDYDQSAIGGDFQVIYNFGQGMIDEAELGVTADGIYIPGFKQPISYEADSRYSDML